MYHCPQCNHPKQLLHILQSALFQSYIHKYPVQTAEIKPHQMIPKLNYSQAFNVDVPLPLASNMGSISLPASVIMAIFLC